MHVRAISAVFAAALSTMVVTAAQANTYLDMGFYCFTNGVRCVHEDDGAFVPTEPFGRSLFNIGSSYVCRAIPPVGYALEKWVVTDFIAVNQSFALSGLVPAVVYDATSDDVSEGGYCVTVSWREEFETAGTFLQLCPCFSWLTYRLRLVPNWPGHDEEDRMLAQADLVYTNAVALAADPSGTNVWTRANYRLVGLSTVPDATDAEFQFGDTVANAGESFGATTNGVVTLYGVWSPRKVTISLDPDGGSVETNAVYVVGDEKCPALPEPTKALHKFAGWFDSKGNEFSEGVEVVAEDGETLALTAEWLSDESSVVLNRRGGTTGDTKIRIVFGERLPLAEMPTRVGYDFAGYFSQQNGKGDRYYTAGGVPTNTISRGGVTTLYAYWTRKKSNVVLDAGGGSGGTTEVVAEYGAGMPEIAVPSRSGFEFTGYSNFTVGGKRYYDASGASAELWDHTSATNTLYAQWTANTYNVFYNYAGGVAGDYQPTNATFGLVFAAGVPRKNGYRFAGYRVSGDFDAETARYGTSMETATSAVKSTTNCKGAEGKPFVYFANLCSANDGTVVLTAQWEKIVEAAASGSKNVAAVPNMARQDVAHRAFVKNGSDAELGDLSRAADCSFKLTTSGARQWTVTNDYATGSESVCSIILPSDQYAKGLIIGEVEGPGILTFQWKWMINSKSTYSNEESGGVEFSYSNAVKEVKCTDFRCSNDWTTVSLVITNVLNKEVTTFKWTANPYKDQNGEYPGYTVWLDDIHWEQKLPKLHVVASSPVEFVYDGSGHGITNIVVKDEGTDEPVANATVKYSLTQDDEFNGEPLLFTNVCTTSVWYSVEADGYAIITDSVTVIIHKATNEWTKLPYITPEWECGESPVVTNGLARFGGEATTSYYCTTNSSSVLGKFPDKNTLAGEYTAVFTVEETANWTGLTTNLPFRVTESKPGSEPEPDPELPKPSAYAEPYDGMYDGLGHGIGVVVTNEFGDDISGDFTIRFSLAESGPFRESPILFTNVCETSVWYSVAATGYQRLLGSAPVVICQATNEWMMFPYITPEWECGESPVVTNGVARFGGEATTSYYCTTNSSSVLGEFPDRDTPAGEYTAVFAVAATDNWSGLTTNLQFRVTEPEPIPGPELPKLQAEASPVDVVYDGAGHGITNVSWRVDGTNVIEASDVAVRYALSREGPFYVYPELFTNVCETSAWYSVTAEGCVGVTNSVPVTIHKATNAWSKTPEVYGDWTAGDPCMVMNGESSFGEVIAEYSTGSSEPPTEYGEYTVSFRVAGTENWTALSTTNMSFRIKARPVFSAIALPCEGAYDGEPHGLEVVWDRVAVGDARIKYSKSQNGPFESREITYVNAMDESETVWFTVEADGYATVTNYGTIMIHKAPNGWLSGPSISGWRDGDRPHNGVAVAEYGEVSVAYATNSAPCTATFTVVETANWFGLTDNVEFTVEGLPPPADDDGDKDGDDQHDDDGDQHDDDDQSGGSDDQGGGDGGGDTPAPSVSGVVPNPAFGKAQTVIGALYRTDGSLAGVMQVKFGKVSRKGVVKVSGTVTLLTGKKVSAKTASMTLDGEEMSGVVVFKSPVGRMDFAMDETGAFIVSNGEYVMQKAVVGGSLQGVSHGVFDLVDGFDLNVSGKLQEDLLPADLTFSVARGKWKFPKNATIKVAKNKVTGEYGRVVDYGKKGDKTNVAALKLSYTAKTGIFKGSFKAYAIEASGKRSKLKKYTVNVYGFVLDGVGVGVATCKRPKGGPWEVSVVLE